FTGHPEWPDTGPGETGVSGLVMVLVARERGSSVRVCEFLVDTWCLGVKNALGPKPVERRKLPSFCADAFRSYPGEPVEVPLVLAQRIVFGAVGYARGLGFEPHADFAKAAGHLGGWDYRARRRRGFDDPPGGTVSSMRSGTSGRFDNGSSPVQRLDRGARGRMRTR